MLRSMPRFLPTALGAVFVLSLAACGRPTPAPGSPAATAAAKAPLLIAPEDVRTLSPTARASGPLVTGSIQPERRADLRAEVAAVVLQVLKDNGEPVKSGELLMRLDDTSIRDGLTSAEASERAALQSFDQAERQFQRLKTLKEQGMTSTLALEDAEVRRNGAQSDLVAARARVVSARQTLQRTAVRAPFDGVVSERKVSVGDTVQIGRELLKVIDPRTMRFEALVSADRVGELKIGQDVRFRVNGVPDVEFGGKLRRVDAAANQTTRQVEVFVAFADPAAAPKVAGLFAEGRVETGSASVIMVPEAALVRAGEQASVWKLDGNKVARVDVRVGDRDARTGEFPVLAGVAAGERILRRPGSTLVDGQTVEFAGGRAPADVPVAVAAPAKGVAGSAAAGTTTATR
jgi:RND family efflux transporter MFP subunit